MSSTYQLSIPDADDTRLDNAMSKRKDLKGILKKDAVKVLLLERIDEIIGDKP
jgi:hypothetical protein